MFRQSFSPLVRQQLDSFPSSPHILTIVRNATKKAGGSTKNGRDSNPKYLGVKKFGDEFVIPGNIIIRQRGLKYRPGENVGLGRDHTLYALKEGHVLFKFDRERQRQVVHIVAEKQNKNLPPKPKVHLEGAPAIPTAKGKLSAKLIESMDLANFLGLEKHFVSKS